MKILIFMFVKGHVKKLYKLQSESELESNLAKVNPNMS
jgi:hypothetical protein